MVYFLIEHRLTLDSDDLMYPKRFLLLGMMLFKDILPILAQDHKDSMSHLHEPDPTDTSVFTPSFILSALHLLIDKLLPLTSIDLERLEDEPEEWVISQGEDEEAWPWEFRVSPRVGRRDAALMAAMR